MLEQTFHIINTFNDIIWEYIGTPLIIIVGLYLTLKLNIIQITKFPQIISEFYKMTSSCSKDTKRGINPLHAFFTSIGGCIGIGNIVAVCTAIQIGGPGALLWMWVAAFLGMAIKYSEVYLGLNYRIPNKQGSFDGGPMYFLQYAFKSPIIPSLVCIFLMFYGTEIYMFNVVTESIASNWNIPKYPVILLLLFLIVAVGKGGVKSVGNVCSKIIPIFLAIYILMAGYVLIANYQNIIPVLKSIVTSAFTGHAAIGAFTGSTLLVTMGQGISRGCYTGDIGIGYASIVHSESQTAEPAKQARLAIFGIFLDTFVVCTATTLMILVTGVWTENIQASHQIQTALAQHFPYMNIFMPIFIFLLGYSSLIAFFCVGAKSAKFLSEKNGEKYYYLFASVSFLIFSFFDQDNVYNLMLLCGGFLIIINLIGIVKLSKQVKLD